MPPRIVVGGGAISELGQLVRDLGVKRPLVVTDPFMVKSGKVDAVRDALGDGCVVWGDTVPEPSTAEVDAGVAEFHKGQHDGVVAFGGGSPMDIAKIVALVAKHGGSAHDYKFPKTGNGQPGFPLVCIPTTAGTGSEVTKVAAITDAATHEKMMCSAPQMMAQAALVDYHTTLTCPARLTADNAIDSLTHAIEAYVSKRHNPVSDMYALKAMTAIAAHTRTAVKEPDNHQAREELMLAATLAGVAFSNASVALVHGMARPLGARFHVPHGMSNAMLLPAITKFSVDAAYDRYAACARAIVPACPSDDKDACVALVQALESLGKDVGVLTPKTFGVDAQDYEASLQVMAEQAIASGSPGNNPKDASVPQIMQLYRDVYA